MLLLIAGRFFPCYYYKYSQRPEWWKVKRGIEISFSKNTIINPDHPPKSSNAILSGGTPNSSSILKTAAFIVRSSGKEIATDKASRADVLKVSFTIAENSIAKSGDRKYYVQVIDSKNNVMGDRQTEKISDKTLTYSFIANVKYANKTVDLVQNIPAEKLEKGTFYVNVFDNGQLVSNTTFTLR